MHDVPTSPEEKPTRSLELAGAAVFFAYSAAQLAQEWILARAPSDSDLEAAYAFALSGLDRFRAIALFVCFLGLPFAYAAVFRRLRRSGWAVAGLVLISLFLALECVLRGLELRLVLPWQQAWLASPEQRPLLSARIELFSSVQLAAYLPLLSAHALGSFALGCAATARDRWTRIVQVALFLNAARAGIRVLAMHGGLALLDPIASASYLPLTLAHALALGVWLTRPAPPR